jgi:hypothetical protein
MFGRLGIPNYINTCSSIFKSSINGCRTASIPYFLMYEVLHKQSSWIDFKDDLYNGLMLPNV